MDAAVVCTGFIGTGPHFLVKNKEWNGTVSTVKKLSLNFSHL